MRWLPVLLLSGVIGIIAGSRLLLSSGEPPLPPTTEAAPPDDDFAADVETGSGFVGETSGTAEPDLSPEDLAVERTDATPTTAPTEGPRVLVVRGAPGQPATQDEPVPMAEVFYVTREEGEARRGQHAGAQFLWPTAWGKRTRTDGEGLAELPPSRGVWLVAARAGAEFAFATVPPGRRMVTMRLQPDESVVVTTVYDDGRPAPSMPVALLQQLGAADSQEIWEGETDADGRATVAHFQLVRRREPDEDTRTPVPEHFAALLRVPNAPPVLATFGGRPATAKPIVLPVPALGSLEVLLTDHQGKPLVSPAVVGATAHQPTSDTGPIRLGRGTPNQTTSKPVGLAPVRLPLFGLGLQLQVAARYPGERRPGYGLMAGPTEPGSLVRVSVPPARTHVVLAGRIVGDDGAPLATARLPASLWRLDRDFNRPTVWTSDDGRFDLVLTGNTEPGPYRLEVRHTLADADHETGDRPPRLLGAYVHVPHLTPGQRVELGDIVLGDLPALASGIVVDDLDQPVAAADVRVQQEIARAERGRNRREEPWRDLPHLTTRTGEDGTFLLCGRLPPGSLRVRADTDRHFADSVPLGAAGQQVRIRIERNGILRGRALLPEFLANGMTTLTMRPFDETLRERDTRRIELGRRAGGRFRIEPLRPGRYDALVEVRNLSEPLLVVADVFVQPGEVRDGRLDVLDLRQSLFRYRLRAVDARGTPMPLDGPILARLPTREGGVAEAGFRWRGGSAELITGCGMADLQFFGRGLVPMRMQLGPGDHDVFVQQQRPAILDVPGARALCGPLRRVRVSVILTEATGYPESLGGIDQRSGQQFSFPRWELGKSSGAWLERSDTVEVPLMKSGRYEVVLRVHATDSERTAQASLSLGQFDLVADSPQPRTVTVPLDAAALQQLLVDLDARHQADQARANEARRR